MINNLVSIITPLYNSEEYISETIETVLSQTYSNWEMLIIDDCSTDNGAKIVKEYCKKDKRIKYIKLEKNSGAAVARNKGIETARGEYIAFLDSDDLWYENKLEKQLNFMKNKELKITSTSYEQIDERSNKLNKVIKTVPRISYNRVLLDCPVGNSTVIYNAKRLGKIEIPNIRKRNDDALWLQMLKKEKYIYGFDEILMKYRIRGNSISSNKLKLIKYHWKLYREIEKLSIIRSIFHICLWCVIKVLKIKEV